jgi:hypothetical protein
MAYGARMNPFIAYCTLLALCAMLVLAYVLLIRRS